MAKTMITLELHYLVIQLLIKIIVNTAHLKYVFQLEENKSGAVGQNSLTPYGNNNLNFQLAHEQVVFLETVENLMI